MRFLRYDEIDPLEAFAISMCGFDWPLTPERLEERIRYDDRWFEDSLLYAVVKGKAVSQAVALRIPTRTVDGEELVAGIAGVATLPSFSRKGISSKLMQELHSRLLEEGIRISFLNTGESLVAYSMYTKLGYRRATYFPSAWKPLSVRKKPMPSILRKYKKKDGAEVDEAYGRFTEGLYGFVIRQKEFFSARMKIHKELKDRLFVVEGNEGVCGYVVKREQDGDVFVQELVIPSIRYADRVLRELESQKKGHYITVCPTGGRKQVEYIRSRGYRLEERSWGVCMVGRLSRRLPYREIFRLYQIKEGKFCTLISDMF